MSIRTVFCVILFYLFYEVFFSFCRKAFKKKSPVKPDSNHLHMLIFDKLQSLNIKNSNALTCLVINLVYCLLILPVCFNFSLAHENALFFRYRLSSASGLSMKFSSDRKSVV